MHFLLDAFSYSLTVPGHDSQKIKGIENSNDSLATMILSKNVLLLSLSERPLY